MFSYPEEEDSEIQMPKLPSNARNLTQDLLLGDMRQHPSGKWKPYLESMTHLIMNKKRLSSFIAVDNEGQVKPLLGQHCPKLTHIFLQENYLTYVGSPAFIGCPNIIQINLFNNMI